MSSNKITRALLSVTDKSGLLDFAQRLSAMGVELVSTGGTAKMLRDGGLAVRDISDLTGFPEMLDGRVKTLHPKVHGGILHIRDNAEHVAAVTEHAIQPIDMVVVNLYAFEKTASKPGVAFADIIENIDIGGPSMVRSAAKNFNDVAIVTAAADYEAIAAEMEANDASLSLATRWRLAKAAFATTAAYDTAIANALETLSEPDGTHTQPATADEAAVPQALRLNLPLKGTLRYGENPHQAAAVYTDGTSKGIANAKQLQGKELSFNNLVDLDACWELASEFAEPACAIIKHTNPCGAATGDSLLDAYLHALEADPISAFGGVIGLNRELDGATAEEIGKLFVEAIVAPSFSPAALEALTKKKNLRLLQIDPAHPKKALKQISGGMLMQDADRGSLATVVLKVVTKRQPTPEELTALRFAWTVTKHVKSNAIVYARAAAAADGTVFGQTVGIGAGQMSRVDAARFGAMKAVLPLHGTVAGSDAFFPFPDGLETVAKAGATAIIQPGGSVRDAEVIEAADRLGIAMVFTGMRHFRHG
jgi:phosphoribosylaminoimidazolecarboxamide formyltransferase/IMP cyclohydrolase